MRKVSIYGLTDATISFSKINLILRGCYKNLDLYPTSIARNVIVDGDIQEKELAGLEKMKLIKVVDQEVKVAVEVKVEEPLVKVEEVSVKKQEEQIDEQIDEQDSVEIIDEDIKEDAIEDVKEDLGIVELGIVEDFQIEGHEGVTFFEKKNIDKSLDVDLSLEAARQLEEEENKVEDVIDNSKLDISERNGNDVIVATGRNTVKKTSIKRSCVDPDDEIKNRDPFIKDIEDSGNKTVKSIKGKQDKRTLKTASRKSSKEDSPLIDDVKIEDNVAFIEKPLDDDKLSDAFVE